MPFVKPNPDKKLEDGAPVNVFDNVRKDFLPADGRMVPANAYWNRMLQRGSVVEVKQPEPEPVAEFPFYNENGEPVDEEGTLLMKAYSSDGVLFWVSKEEEFTPEEIEHFKQHPELVGEVDDVLKAVEEAETGEPANTETAAVLPVADAPPEQPPGADAPQESVPPAADAETKTVAKTTKKTTAKTKTE